MKRSILTGIVAGSALVMTAAFGFAGAAAGQSPPWRSGGLMDWGMVTGPMGTVHGPAVRDEAGYLTEMVAHHSEAVAAAGLLRRSGRAQMRTLGASIVKTQNAEITTMRSWLTAWYPGSPAASGYRPMMRDLSTLSGDDLDRTFLEDMIAHHMMAVMMSQRLLASGRVQHGELAAFAANVRDAQHAEMFQMQRYLTDWFGDSSAMYGPGRCRPSDLSPGLRSGQEQYGMMTW